MSKRAISVGLNRFKCNLSNQSYNFLRTITAVGIFVPDQMQQILVEKFSRWVI